MLIPALFAFDVLILVIIYFIWQSHKKWVEKQEVKEASFINRINTLEEKQKQIEKS